MNIDYRKVILAFIAAVIIAIPTAAAFQNRTNQIEAERQDKSRLQLDVKKKSTELEQLKIQTEEQRKKDEAEKQRIQQENEQLKKDLQAKRERQENERQLAAAQVTRPAAVSVGISGNCETYRPLVQKYFGAATASAMITMQKESGCNPTAVSPTNDHGLFQLNGQPVYDPEANIRIAYAKFVSPRRGTNPNWSAWYAVCTPNLVPKFDGIWCS
jgi:soluble lytic murein transglycosylase-like protein